MLQALAFVAVLAVIDILVGSFLGEFGLVVAGSVMISLFVALTLTPMLAARVPPAPPRAEGSIYDRLERGFDTMERTYRRLLAFTFEHRALTVATTLGSLVLAYFFATQLETEFFPPADEGIFFAMGEALPGTSLETTDAYLEQDRRWFLEQSEIVGVFSASGSGGGFDPPRSNQYMMFGTLSLRSERERTVMELIEAARRDLSGVPGRKVRVFNPAESMMGSGGGFKIELRGDVSLEELDRISDDFMAGLAEREGIVDIDKSLKLGLPELRVVPDREKAASMGVDAIDIARAIQLMVGGLDVGIFKEEGRRIDIRMRLEDELRDDPSAIGSLAWRRGTTERSARACSASSGPRR